MTVLITGICGFVGIDNLSRAGSEMNRRTLRDLGITVRHGFN